MRASFVAVRRFDRARCALLAALILSSCQSPPSPTAVGPAGGVVASADDGLTLVLWPGALGQWEDFEITPSDMPPEAFGQAYRVQPNVSLGVDAEIILRGDLPAQAGKARVGAITSDDFAVGEGDWSALVLEPGGIDEAEGTVRAHDDEIALYYAMLDDGSVVPTTDTNDTSSETDPTTDTEPGTDSDPTGPPLSFAADVQPILDANCTNPAGCHGVMPSGSLSLDTGAYDNLVGVQAVINGAYTRVVSGDSTESLMMMKLDYDPPGDGGLPMPTGGMLPADALDTVRSWIDQGCPP